MAKQEFHGGFYTMSIQLPPFEWDSLGYTLKLQPGFDDKLVSLNMVDWHGLPWNDFVPISGVLKIMMNYEITWIFTFNIWIMMNHEGLGFWKMFREIQVDPPHDEIESNVCRIHRNYKIRLQYPMLSIIFGQSRVETWKLCLIANSGVSKQKRRKGGF